MTAYSLTVYDAPGRRELVMCLECESDDQAKRLVRENIVGHVMELRQDQRQVAVFDPEGRELFAA